MSMDSLEAAVVRNRRRPGRIITPTVLQMEAVECGAASLGMILAFHGLFVPLEKLRLECGVSRDGSKASNILKTARSNGLIAKGFRMELEEFYSAQFPNIVFWGFCHFVVVEGFRKGGVCLNDPAYGPRFVTDEEFNNFFTGIVLTFKPGPDFKPRGSRPDIVRSLLSRLAGTKRAFIYLTLASFFLVVPGLVIPAFSKIFVDNILVGGLSSWIFPLLWGMGFTALLRGVLTWLQQYFLVRLEFKFAVTSASRFFWHVLHLPMEFFSQRYPGDIAGRVGLNDRIAGLLSGQLSTNAVNLLMIVFYALVMVCYNPLLTLAGIVIAVVNFITLRYISAKRVDTNRRLQQEEGKLLGTTMDGLKVIESLKAGGSESDFFSKWAGYQAKVVTTQQELGLSGLVLIVLPTFLTMLANALILTIGGMKVIDGSMTVGMLVAFQTLMSSFMAPVNQLVSLGSAMQMAEADINRLDDVLHYQTDRRFRQRVAVDDLAGPPAKLNGRVELRNVTFGYSRLEPPLIEKLNLILEPGARVAIVGASGSGKSTVAKVVSGLYDPWEGEILFDGRPAESIHPLLMRNSLAMVDQDIFLFEGTVRENLTMWDASIPDSTVIIAAKDAAIHEEIAARPGAYGSKVDEWGGNFSGGQRQRLEIARALASEPSVMVLDEATSALDPKTEMLIDGNLRRRGCTCLLVAHRLSSIRDCDEIIVLDNGKVAQRGTHEELIQKGGLYLSLISQT